MRLSPHESINMTRLFRVYTAPSVSPLLDHLVMGMRLDPLPPREQETIVVQSQGMRRWLTLQLADAFGCVGSIALPFPASFVREMGRCIESDNSPRVESDPFSRDVLAWRVDALLRALPPHDATFQALHRYLVGTDDRTRFGLAAQIAGRFDDYQLYRADLLCEWEAGRHVPDTPHADWQASIWRSLCAETAGATPHLAARLRHTIDALHGGDSTGLPSRVSVFGVSTLPPLFVELLEALSQHIPVSVYSAALDSSNAHPLATAFSTQSRDFLSLLASHGATHATLETPVNTSRALLPSLQREMATNLAGDSSITLTLDDSSLRIHSAHGSMRQLEILRDQLLAALQDDPTLRPHDVLLLVPDTAAWAPLVNAVFGLTTTSAERIPYRIADQPMRSTQPAADAFSRMLALEGGRLARSEIFGLLAHPLVQKAAQLTASDVDLLDQLTRRINVRWGYDAKSRAALGLPAYEEASWRAGLDRLLLGVAVGRADDLILGVLAESGDTAGNPEILARLADWVDALASMLHGWREPRSLASWCTTIAIAIDQFLRGKEPEAPQLLTSLIKMVERLRTIAALAIHTEHVSFGVVRDWIEGELNDDSFGSGFLMGGMTVAALKPMRGLPFRVVAVAGLDNGVFPRHERRNAFDLLEHEHRVGDRDLGADDRQLFLDLVLSSTDALILSYNGRAVSDNSPRAPSVVIDDLLDYLDRRTNGAARRELVVTHPLQPFSATYFTSNRDARLFTFSEMQATAARAIQNRTPANTPFVTAPIVTAGAASTWSDLSLRELTDFWTNPSKCFCKSALRFSLGYDTADVADDELFALNAMKQGGIKSRILAGRLNGEYDDDRRRQRMLANGDLPHGALGAAWYESLAQVVHEVLAHVPDGESMTVPITIADNGWRLHGRIDGIRGDCRYVVRAGGVRAEHRIRAWVEHLAMCVASENGIDGIPTTTILIGKNGPDETFPFVTDASSALNAIVRECFNGLKTPAPFFVQAGWAWFDASRPKKRKTVLKDPKRSATEAFLKTSNEYSAMGGDGEDESVALCFRATDPICERWDEFEALCHVLFDRWIEAGAKQ